MKAIVQRILEAKVEIGGEVYSEIGYGILVLIAFNDNDLEKQTDWMINKILNLRIFNDSENKMNLSVTDLRKDILIVSNFTVYGDSAKGFRPSYMESASSDKAKIIYDKFIKKIKCATDLKIATGVFGADMKVHLINDGPVTLIIETKN